MRETTAYVNNWCVAQLAHDGVAANFSLSVSLETLDKISLKLSLNGLFFNVGLSKS